MQRISSRKHTGHPVAEIIAKGTPQDTLFQFYVSENNDAVLKSITFTKTCSDDICRVRSLHLPGRCRFMQPDRRSDRLGYQHRALIPVSRGPWEAIFRLLEATI